MLPHQDRRLRKPEVPFCPAVLPSIPPDRAAPNPAGPGNDDPEKNARAFLEQNRKVAQGELRNLKDEAEQLRTRLGKVEAGIRRWEALLAALDNSEKTAAPGPGMPPGADRPTDLRPIDGPKRAMAVQESAPSAPRRYASAAEGGAGRARRRQEARRAAPNPGERQFAASPEGRIATSPRAPARSGTARTSLPM